MPDILDMLVTMDMDMVWDVLPMLLLYTMLLVMVSPMLPTL